MGCGGSKLDPNQDDVPARFKPILRCRLEEIRARRNSNTTTTTNTNGLSKKQLLGEAVSSQESSDRDEHDAGTSTPPDHPEIFHDTQECPPTLQKIGADNDSSSTKVSQVVGNDVHVCVTSTPPDGEGLLGQCGCGVGMTDISPKRQVSGGYSEGSMEECDSEDSVEQGRCLGHGSPSFRVYCTVFPEDDNLLEEHIDDHEDNTIEAQRHSIGLESSSSNEVSVRPMPKKGKRGRKFKKMMMMPKAGGKIFTNMPSFYHFPCSSQSNTHLLHKAAA